MERLAEIQRKNAFLMKLQNHIGKEAGQQQLGLFAEALLRMHGAFGISESLSILTTLSNFLPLVSSELLSVLCEECEEIAPSRVDTPCLSASCHATIEGVDLAQSALEDFINSYYMFHNLDAESSGDILKYFPFLGFMESHIYDLDQANEDSLQPEQRLAGLPQDPFVPLRRVLEERAWMSVELEKEFQQGTRFWALERKICAALASKSPQINQHEVEEALKLKSFDYRAMNLLLYKMRGAEPNNVHMDFLATSEVLVEIGDDLVDYYDDIDRNSFNIYRCFVAIHGLDKGVSELRKFISSAEKTYLAAFTQLQQVDPPLAAKWLQRSMSSRRFNCGCEKPEGANWEIPPSIHEQQWTKHDKTMCSLTT